MDGNALGMGVGSGLMGLWEAYRWMKELATKDRIEQDRNATDIQRAKIQEIIAQIGATSREHVAGLGLEGKKVTAGAATDTASIGANSRRDVATINAGAANTRSDAMLKTGMARSQAAVDAAKEGAGARRYAADKGFAGAKVRSGVAYNLGKERNAISRENNRLDLYGNLFRPQSSTPGLSWLPPQGVAGGGASASPQTQQRPPFNSFIDSLGLPKSPQTGEDEFDQLVAGLLNEPDEMTDDTDADPLSGGGMDNQAIIAEATKDLQEFQALQAQGKYQEAERKRLELVKKYGALMGGR